MLYVFYNNVCFSTKIIQQCTFFQLFISTLRSCRALSSKFIFCGFAKTQLGNVFKTCIFMNILRLNVIYSVWIHFSEICENHNPLVQLSKKHEKKQKIWKNTNLKKKCCFFRKHNWKQVIKIRTCMFLMNANAPQRWENTKTEYGNKVSSGNESTGESISWSGQSEKKGV